MSSSESNFSDQDKQLVDFVMDFSNPFSDLFPELIDLKNCPNFMHKSYQQDSFEYFDDFNHSPSCSSSESDVKYEVLPSGPESDIPCPVDFHFHSLQQQFSFKEECCILGRSPNHHTLHDLACPFTLWWEFTICDSSRNSQPPRLPTYVTLTLGINHGGSWLWTRIIWWHEIQS